MNKQEKLSLWQGRLARNESAYSARLARMNRREELYEGTNQITPMVTGERKRKTPHVRNICAELIEAQTDSNIPQPKVAACRPEDEDKARLIEDMLRNELDRMPFERMNDMMERTVPIQGGAAFLVEWDNQTYTHATVGELAVSTLHPKQIIPQDGVFTGVEDMDYIILKIPQTRQSILQKYGIEMEEESEQEPDVRRGESGAEDLITQYVAYYRNDAGGIGLYSWANETVLEDREDYQARQQFRCTRCGSSKPGAGNQPETCPECGGKTWEEREELFEEIYVPIERSDGSVIPGMVTRETIQSLSNGEAEYAVSQEPTRIPFYKPDIFPVILQKNVSIYGQFLGDSDIDKIEDQQNTINRLEAKIIDKLLKSGSYITLPSDASIKTDASDMKVIYPGSPADKAMIDVFDLQGNVEYDLAYLAQVYEEARQAIGITDSYQGRHDTTALSGKAKEFAAAQSAGRLESKHVMKYAAYAALFEAMFKFRLAYADEPRPVASTDIHGDTQYRVFNRYDFLEQDAAGEWHWNDRFLFSCDVSAPLASNRESMWQETRLNFENGTFGDPSRLETLILFWTKMKMLHYPGAGETKSYLEEELRRQRLAQEERKNPNPSLPLADI